MVFKRVWRSGFTNCFPLAKIRSVENPPPYKLTHVSELTVLSLELYLSPGLVVILGFVVPETDLNLIFSSGRNQDLIWTYLILF